MATDQELTSEQLQMFVRLDAISDEIRKGQYLNAHFRAFELANVAWEQHVRANAAIGMRVTGSPAGAVLADDAPVVDDPGKADPPGPPDPPRPPSRRDVGSPAKGPAEHSLMNSWNAPEAKGRPADVEEEDDSQEGKGSEPETSASEEAVETESSSVEPTDDRS